MCDYSLQKVVTRPANAGDKLISTRFGIPLTRGFAAVGEPNIAVCLLPGTEIAFENEAVECDPDFPGCQPNHKIKQTVAVFRRINCDQPYAHHDALEFPDGKIILLTRVCAGQRATVLQLPATSPELKEKIADHLSVLYSGPAG